MESLDQKTLDYNYKELELVDMRYRGDEEKGYYLLSFYDAYTETTLDPVNINNSIFESVLKKYFTPLFFDKVNREDIMKLEWNARVSKGEYYVWNDQTRRYNVKSADPNRLYVSRIDVSGNLSNQTYS
jgi:hypothetical protein